MKKILILFTMLTFSLTTFSQEKKEFELVDEKTVEVKIYRNDILKEKGYMVNIGDKWVNDGVWSQYNKNGKVNLKVKYYRGTRQWISKKYNNYVVTINKKEGI